MANIISLDIETYGMCERDANNNPLPTQRYFHPIRSLHQDRVPLNQQVLTVAITLPKEHPPERVSLQTLSQIEPGDTMIFQMDRVADRKHLFRWLSWADTICGMNLAFDLTYLAHQPATFAALNKFRHTLVDISIFSFLESDVRPERSLKDLALLFGVFRYRTRPKQKDGSLHRFPSPLDAEFRHYQASDTHAALLVLRSIAARIIEDWGADSPKAHNRTLQFHSDNIWSAIRMKLDGIPVHLPSVRALERDSLAKCAEIEAALGSVLPLAPGVKGSKAAKHSIVKQALDECDSSGRTLEVLGLPTIYDHHLVEITEKTKELSASTRNRAVALAVLPPSSPIRQTLSLWQQHSELQTRISRFTYPILRHARNDEEARSSLAVGANSSGVAFCYPDIFLTPSSVKDGEGGLGGQRQARWSIKNPAVQQFDKEAKSCFRSRYSNGVIASYDLSQIELRTLAVVSGEPSLLDAYNLGLDLHTDRAISIYTEPVLVERYGENFRTSKKFRSSDERQGGKMVNFADGYLSSPETMQAQMLSKYDMLVPYPLLVRAVQTRPVIRPVLWDWQHSIIARAHDEGVILLPIYGEHRTFLQGTKYDSSEIVNFPIQAHAANTLKDIQRHIHKRLGPLLSTKRICLIANIYDAIYFDCPSDLIPELQGLLSEALNHVQNSGYWAALTQLSGAYCPLGGELTLDQE